MEIPRLFNLICKSERGKTHGGTQYKRPYGDVPPSKISLSVYEWPLIKCKIWYMNGLIFFAIFPKFEPKLAQISENFRKSRRFCLKFGPKLGQLVYKWVTFSWKMWYFMGLLSNSAAAHPYQNQTWVPPENTFHKMWQDSYCFIKLWKFQFPYIVFCYKTSTKQRIIARWSTLTKIKTPHLFNHPWVNSRNRAFANNLALQKKKVRSW